MKMKRACETTGLTERAIRLYLSKQLLAPGQVNGILDFSAEDIQRLRDIAVLRQFDFTIEQIAGMAADPAAIQEILRARMDDTRADVEHVNEVNDVLGKLEVEACSSLHMVADQIRERRMRSPELYFCQFDEITDEERRLQRQEAINEVSVMERRSGLLRRLVTAVCLVLAVCLAAGVYLAQTRVEGFVSLSPMTVTKVHGRMLMIEDVMVTVQTSNGETVQALGTDTITVPYSPYSRQLEAGMTLDNACQLTIRLTNMDLLRMGINPLQTMHTRNKEINDAWMRYVLQTLFAQDYVNNVTLVVREYTGLQPIF